MIKGFVGFVASIIIGFLGAYLISLRGLNWGFVDVPSLRSSHSNPLPKGGGLGILAAFIVCAISLDYPYYLWIPACILAIISFVGDSRETSFCIRLALQFVCAGVFCGAVFGILTRPENFSVKSLFLFLAGTLFIVATANYYNFMDGINGLAGWTGVIAFTALGLFGLAEGKEIGWALGAFYIAGACLGFLPLNYPQARVFMGDVGSILLGFLFSSWIIIYARSFRELIIMISFLYPFYFDELTTFCIRIKDGEKITKAHRRHIYQVLVNQAGISHTKVTLAFASIQVSIVFIIWMLRKSLFLILLTLIAISAFLVWGGKIVRQRWEFNKIANV